MPKYANKGGNSAIISYEITEDSITVVFKGNAAYLYDASKPGQAHVDEMKALAESGQGLNTYISKYVRKNYAEKLS